MDRDRQSELNLLRLLSTKTYHISCGRPEPTKPGIISFAMLRRNTYPCEIFQLFFSSFDTAVT